MCASPAPGTLISPLYPMTSSSEIATSYGLRHHNVVEMLNVRYHDGPGAPMSPWRHLVPKIKVDRYKIRGAKCQAQVPVDSGNGVVDGAVGQLSTLAMHSPFVSRARYVIEYW
jgi:hypothetical protein